MKKRDRKKWLWCWNMDMKNVWYDTHWLNLWATSIANVNQINQNECANLWYHLYILLFGRWQLWYEILVIFIVFQSFILYSFRSKKENMAFVDNSFIYPSSPIGFHSIVILSSCVYIIRIHCIINVFYFFHEWLIDA